MTMIRNILTAIAKRIAKPHVLDALWAMNKWHCEEVNRLNAEILRLQAVQAKPRSLHACEAAVPCTHDPADQCGAAAGDHCCKRKGNHGLRCRPHESRRRAWETQARQDLQEVQEQTSTAVDTEASSGSEP